MDKPAFRQVRAGEGALPDDFFFFCHFTVGRTDHLYMIFQEVRSPLTPLDPLVLRSMHFQTFLQKLLLQN